MEDQVTSSLTPKQRQDALAAASAARTSVNDQLNKILDYVAPSGTVDATKLGALVSDTKKKFPNTSLPDLTGLTSDEIKSRLQNNQNAVNKLYQTMTTTQGG